MNKNFVAALILGVSLAASAQTPPTQPPPFVPEECASNDQACRNRNQANQAAYQSAMANYQTSVQSWQAYEAQVAAAAAAAASSQQAALASAKAAEDANSGGKKSFLNSQTICTAISMALTAVCMTPGGQSACPPAAMFGMLAGMAGDQAATHAASQYSACTTANKISTTQSNCGSAPPPYNPGAYPANAVGPIADAFDGSGNCVATAAQCQAILDGLPPGTNIKDVNNGISQFASGKGPFSLNPDGTVKMKNGKTYGMGDFADKNAMLAAGFTAAQADSMLAMLAKSKLGELDAKGALAKENESSGEMTAGAGAAGVKSGEGSDNGAADGKDLNKTRGLASEGLTKDFNGELIGAAGDDIFKMMNRRYKLKAKQDSFLTIKP